MQIRYATMDDLDELKVFYIKMNEVINRRTNKYNPDNEVFPTVAMITDAIDSMGQFVGIEDGRIVAAAILNHECADTYMSVQWQIDVDRQAFWVLHAFRVLPEYEGRGFAKQMLKYILEIAPKRGQKAIRLDCLDGYEVGKMYTDLGFKYIDTVNIMYDDIGYPEAFRLYEIVLFEEKTL